MTSINYIIKTVRKNFIPGILTGYQNWEDISGSMMKGGCGFNISFVITQELSKKHLSSQSEYDAQWMEIMHTNKENLVLGVGYRHPTKKNTEFLQNLKQTPKTLSKKTKRS